MEDSSFEIIEDLSRVLQTKELELERMESDKLLASLDAEQLCKKTPLDALYRIDDCSNIFCHCVFVCLISCSVGLPRDAVGYRRNGEPAGGPEEFLLCQRNGKHHAVDILRVFRTICFVCVCEGNNVFFSSFVACGGGPSQPRYEEGNSRAPVSSRKVQNATEEVEIEAGRVEGD